MDALTVLTIFSTTICFFVVIRSRPRSGSWSIAAMIGLSTGLVGYLANIGWLQLIACLTTLIFILLPGVLMNRVRKLMQVGEFRRAYALSLKIPVPKKRWGPYWPLWPILAEYYEGNPGPAEEQMAHYAASDAPHAVQMYEALQVHLRPFKEIQMLSEPVLQARLCLEHGRIDEGLELFTRIIPTKISWMHIKAFRQNIIPPICFAGLVHEARILVQQTRLPPGIGDAWIATALAANGQTEEARAKLQTILDAPDPTGMGHRMAEVRLENLPTPSQLNLSAQDGLHIFRQETHAGAILQPGRPQQFPSVLLSIVGLLAFFGYQIWRGGLGDGAVLWELGALFPGGEFPEEPWRLLHYGLLHGGWLHLLTNLFSLAVIGPFVVRALGASGFVFVFLGGIILGGIGISFFGQAHLTIGASGGVMALMASMIPICIWHPGVRGSRTARGFLNLILTVCLLQAAVDASNAVISFAGHTSGVVSGIVLGGIALLFTRKSSENLDQIG